MYYNRHNTGLPRLARSLLTLIGLCRIFYVFKIKAGSFWKRYLSCNRFARKQFVRVRLFEEKSLFTFYHHGLRYGCSRISSSFGRLFLDPRMGNILFSAKHLIYKRNTHTYTKWNYIQTPPHFYCFPSTTITTFLLFSSTTIALLLFPYITTTFLLFSLLIHLHHLLFLLITIWVWPSRLYFGLFGLFEGKQ